MASLIEKFNGLVDEVEKVSEGNPIKNLGNKKAKPFKKKNEGGGVCMNQGQNGECTAGCETLKAAEPCNATDDQTKCSCYKAPTSEAADEEDDKDKEDDDSKDKEDSDDTDSDAKDDTEDDKDKEDDEEKDESVPFFRKNDTIRVSRQHESGCSTKKKKKNEEDDEEDSDKDGDDDSSDDTDTDDEEDKDKDDEINDKDEVANTVDSDLIDKITATKKKYTEDEFDDYLSKIDSKIDGAVYDNTVAALKKSGVIKESNVKRHDEALDYQGGDVYEMQDGTMHIVIDNDPASFRSVSFAPLDDNIGAAVSGLDLGSNSISSWVDSEAFDGNVATFVGNFAEYTPPEIVNAEVADGADPGTMESKKK